ncbi:hypothetical protein ACKWTF_004181 [Chironomus riparius]
MNSEKLLVKLNNVPKYVSMRQLWIEITKLMNYSYMAAKDLAGIYIDTDTKGSIQLHYWYLYFFQINSINKLKRACNQEEGKLVLYLLNSKIEVIFPGKNYWSLSMMTNVNLRFSTREIKVKTRKYEAIVDILKNLDKRLTRPRENEQPIESCVQAKELTFIKFKTPTYAARAIEELTISNYEVKYSRSYMCLCYENNEEINLPKRTESQAVSQDIPTTSNNSQQETLALNISKEPIAHDSKKTIIKIGSIKMRDFLKKFKIQDTIHFTLTSSDKEQQLDNDILMLNEEIDLSD